MLPARMLTGVQRPCCKALSRAARVCSVHISAELTRAACRQQLRGAMAAIALGVACTLVHTNERTGFAIPHTVPVIRKLLCFLRVGSSRPGCKRLQAFMLPARKGLELSGHDILPMLKFLSAVRCACQVGG